MRRSVVPQLRVIRKGGNVWDTLEKTISQQTHAKMAKSKPAVHIVEGSRDPWDPLMASIWSNFSEVKQMFASQEID